MSDLLHMRDKRKHFNGINYLTWSRLIWHFVKNKNPWFKSINNTWNMDGPQKHVMISDEKGAPLQMRCPNKSKSLDKRKIRQRLVTNPKWSALYHCHSLLWSSLLAWLLARGMEITVKWSAWSPKGIILRMTQKWTNIASKSSLSPFC